jgi:hypothetical protein
MTENVPLVFIFPPAIFLPVIFHAASNETFER